MKKPSVILLGSKPGAVVALKILIERNWEIKHVVSCPEHEYNWLPKPDIEEVAKSANLSVLKSQFEIPNADRVDFVISYMYRHLVRSRVLKIARIAALNFHAGPLPEFGGWAFYNAAILESAKEYGSSCHYMSEEFDCGPLLKVSRFPIDAGQETALTLERKAQVNMIKLFSDFCDLAERGEQLPFSPQDPNKMRYMSRDEFEALKEIPCDANSEEIDRRARAFWYPPFTCAHMIVAGKKIEVQPEIAKKIMAKSLHVDDIERLLAATNITTE